MEKIKLPIEGGCDCKKVRYQLMTEPMVIHCCHCTWCQRETGASFALNAMVETDRINILKQKPEIIVTPSNSGKGQKIHRCPECKIAVWSNYGGGGDKLSFVRVGTLDNPNQFPPDIHIFTSTKQPWLILDSKTPAFAEFYEREKLWKKENLERLKTLFS